MRSTRLKFALAVAIMVLAAGAQAGNMSFDAFIAQRTGQPVDFDGVYPNQCMDLMHQYVYDVLGVPSRSALGAPAAYQVYANFDAIYAHELFTRFENTPTAVPAKGDIMFWGQTIGEFGHVAIFVDGDVNSFRSFDANWPLGSLPHIQSHTYHGVLGWLRLKTSAPSPVPAPKPTPSPAPKPPPAQPGLVNVNTADAATLASVKGIGPKAAAEIISYRAAHGRIANAQELLNIKYLGKARVALALPYITF